MAWPVRKLPVVAGDPQPLIHRLGSVAELDSLVVLDTDRKERLSTATDLRQFLQTYVQQSLIEREWPAIQQAFHLSNRGAWREVVALDQHLGKEAGWMRDQETSCRIGRLHLRRLRPLRDQRGLQRYHQAVKAGRAQGWHSIVYGVVLAVFYLPLPQGLLHYAEVTLHHWIGGRAEALALSPASCQDLLEQVSQPLAPALKTLLASSVLEAGRIPGVIAPRFLNAPADGR